MKTVEIGSQFGGEIITGLATFTTYSVVIQAFNSKGTGPLSEPVIARTLEGGELHIYIFCEKLVNPLNVMRFFAQAKIISI